MLKNSQRKTRCSGSPVAPTAAMQMPALSVVGPRSRVWNSLPCVLCLFPRSCIQTFYDRLKAYIFCVELGELLSCSEGELYELLNK